MRFLPSKWSLPFLILGIAPFLVGWFHVLSEDAWFSANPHLEYSAVKDDPRAHRGETLILAGQIVANESSENGSVLEILCYRTDDEGKPVEADPRCGKMRVNSKRILDPERYRAGRLVTLTGTVTGEMSDGLPVFDAGELHLWSERKDRRTYPPAYYDPWCGPWHYDPWCDPFYSPHPFRPGWRGSLWWGTGW